MSEITKYIVTGFSFDPTNNSLNATYAELPDAKQPVCMWSDVEPIVQRNIELEAERARLLKPFGESQSDQPMLILDVWQVNAALNARIDELTEELARLREQEPEYYVSTDEERDIALNTLAEMFESAKESEGEDGLLMSVSIDLWHEGCDALEVLIGGEDDAEPKPAQEIPAELVAWANSWKEDDSDMTSYLIGCNDMKHFVKSQLGKMKCGA